MLEVILLLVCVGLMVEHPLVVLSVLMIMSIMVTVFMYFIMGSYWFSCMVLLVVLSGILVVFSYMVSLVSNEGFYYDLVSVLFGMMVVLLLGTMIVDGVGDMSLFSLSLWMGFDSLFNLFVLVLLLGVMLVVVWVVNFYDGALRI